MKTSAHSRLKSFFCCALCIGTLCASAALPGCSNNNENPAESPESKAKNKRADKSRIEAVKKGQVAPSHGK